MGDILFLADAMPSHLGRSDRVRAFHLLKHLSDRTRVHLIAFAEEPDDLKRKDALVPYCATRNILWRSNPSAQLRLSWLLRNIPGSISSPEDEQMRTMIKVALTARRVDAIFAQARVARLVPERLQHRLVVDLGEPGSLRAAAFADTASFMSRPSSRWQERLHRKYERAIVERANATLFAHQSYADLFEAEVGRVLVVENGVDSSFHDPAAVGRRLESTGTLIALAGQMNARADREAGQWFMDAVFPHVQAAHPNVSVLALASNASGALHDLAERHPKLIISNGDHLDWIKAAAMVVAPWLHAGGSTIPLLEAMAMARPIVASATAAATLDHGGTVQTADTVGAFADSVLKLLSAGFPAEEIGRSARARVRWRYDWEMCLPPQDLIIGSRKLRYS